MVGEDGAELIVAEDMIFFEKVLVVASTLCCFACVCVHGQLKLG